MNVGVNKDSAGWWISTREDDDVRIWSHAPGLADALALAKRIAGIERYTADNAYDRNAAARAFECLNGIEFVAGPDPRD